MTSPSERFWSEKIDAKLYTLQASLHLREHKKYFYSCQLTQNITVDKTSWVSDEYIENTSTAHRIVLSCAGQFVVPE
jgi:hypothetical protein